MGLNYRIKTHFLYQGVDIFSSVGLRYLGQVKKENKRLKVNFFKFYFKK